MPAGLPLVTRMDHGRPLLNPSPTKACRRKRTYMNLLPCDLPPVLVLQNGCQALLSQELTTIQAHVLSCDLHLVYLQCHAAHPEAQSLRSPVGGTRVGSYSLLSRDREAFPDRFPRPFIGEGSELLYISLGRIYRSGTSSR